MNRQGIAALLIGAGVFASQAQRAPVAPQQPTFRAGVDLVQVDVSVLDQKRRPVRGLTVADFRLLEDGQARPIVAFSPVDLPDREPKPAASWMRDIAPDVATNSLPEEGRLVVIVMDRTIPLGVPTMNARNIAKAAVDALGPGDLAAVVYTGFGIPQNFTADRARLLGTIGASNPGAEPSDTANEIEAAQIAAIAEDTGITLPVVSNTGACYCGLCVLETVMHVADAVRDVARRRKSLLFIGRDLTIQTADVECGGRVKDARVAMFRSLDLANLTVHAFDPSGLETLAVGAESIVRGPRAGAALSANLQNNLVRQGNIGVLPDRTGGRTVMNTNDAGTAMRDVFRESDSYYLLGFEPANPMADGRLHDIKVTVNRPGLDVRTRHGYLAATSLAVAARANPGTPGRSAPMEAITGLMPKKNGISLGLSVAAFEVPGKSDPVLALFLSVQHDVALDGREAAAANPGARRINVVVGVFSRTGQSIGTLRQTLEATARTGANGSISYEVLSRLPLRTGHYELRVGVEDTTLGQAGSVYTYVDVPDYSNSQVSLSDIVLQAPWAGAAAPANELAGLLPLVPTARREFARTESVTAFLRVYQSSGATVVPVALSARIRDDTDRRRFERQTSLSIADFESGRVADHQLTLPMNTLAPGAYLLTIEAKAGKVTARRDVRFSIR